MSFALRDYQQSAHDAVFKEWETHQTTLGVAATGLGKTVIFAAIIKSIYPKRALVLAHRTELIDQAKEKIQAIAGVQVEIEKAEQYASANLFNRHPVVVSSIQTQISGPPNHRRYKRFNPLDYSVLICDEAHRSLSASWQEVINYYRTNPNLRVLGVTATPDRADEKAMGKVYESVAFNHGILDGIQNGWLVDITQQFVSVSSLDFSHVRTTAGDLNEGDLCRVMEAEENIQGICQPTLEAIHGLAPKSLSSIPVPEWRGYLKGLGVVPRRTIVFTVSVAQAEMCCSVFSRAMDGIAWVCGKTPKDKRSEILDNFKSGKIHVVANCGVLCEGFDEPAVELIAMARPTKSRCLYAQIAGRSLRPLPGLVDGISTAQERRDIISKSSKPFARVLDFTGVSEIHKLISLVDILGSNVSEEAVDAARAKAMKEGKVVRILVTLTNAQLDLEKKRREELERKQKEENARLARILAKSNFDVENRDPFGNRPSEKGGKLDRPKFTGKPLSESQKWTLRRNGKDPSEVKSWAQAQFIIGRIFHGPPHPEDVSFLKKKGIKTVGMNYKMAREAIKQFKANGGKNPN